MQYSIVDGQKTEAQPNLVGVCQCCNKPTYSACGNLITWHWRHRSKKDCDAWWETETDWHREWKSNFPQSWREVVHYDNETNEKHIADVKTHKEIILEFQNSPITFNELKSRESFYKKMIWIVNGISFKDNFEFGHKLPDPSSKFPNNIQFFGLNHLLAYNNINDPDDLGMVELLQKIDNVPIKEVIEKYHTKHYTFTWKKVRQIWLQTQMPVFIDFNDGILWRILFKNNFCDKPFCCYYSKKEFIKHYTK